MAKIYAYVTSETCAHVRAVEPSELVDSKPVSRHGDYNPWYYGKRETLRFAAGENVNGRLYLIRAAKAVTRILGWW